MEPYEIREQRGVATEVGTPVATTPVATTPATSVATRPAAVASSSRVGVYPSGYRATQVVWLVVGVLDIILGLDLVFRLAGAANTGFYHLIFAMGSRLSGPFDGIFGTTLNSGASQFRGADLVAIAVYSLAGWIVAKIVRIATAPRANAAGY